MGPITSQRFEATGYLTDGDTFLVGLSVQPGATAGRITITNGSGGATLFDIDTPASATATVEIKFINEGVSFPGGMYVSALTNVTSATAYIQSGSFAPTSGSLAWSTLTESGWGGITEGSWGGITP